MQEHKIKLEELYKKLESSETGLTTEQAEKRLTEHGKNILKTKKQTSLILKFLKQFTNFFALLLIAGSLLAFLAEHLSPGEGYLYIGIALIGVVFLNSIFTFLQQYQSEKIVESFKKMLPTKTEVLRDNQRQIIFAENLVPGDIIFLSQGDKVPVDCRLIEHQNLKVDNSSITGEAEPQLRKIECTHENILESRNMCFSGTFIQSGTGKALVYATGMSTEIGKIIRLTKETKQTPTRLHKELNRFIKIISTIALILGFIFFIISSFTENQFIGSLIFAIGIIVANVPEGLLPTVTLSLSLVAKRMSKKNALIKNLESIETLGSTTVICTDKTGTLTENKMKVNTLFIDLKEKNVYEKDLKKTKSLPKLTQTMILCNNSIPSRGEFYGDPTETSLIYFSKKFTKINEIKQQKRIHESPFDSKTKRMITTNLLENKKIAHLKGAPEVVLRKCNKILINNQTKTLTKSQKKLIKKYYEKIASRGERVLGFGYKETKTIKTKESGFIFLGLAGILDPPRREVPKAIEKCKSAGIKIIMITGDHSLTAEAIARKTGLIKEKAEIITGEELNKLNDERLKNELKKENLIFSRTNPEQKLRIVKTLQALGEIVTVTGDGVNDAPALKNADIGVSMGISGTEVAREASQMILMDDNFATIVNAVEEGRTIFSNIKKFIAYILTSNIPEILPFIAFVLLKIPLPLTVILILAIDLGTDLIPAIGLGTEKPEKNVMSQGPRSKNERLLTKNLLFMSYGIIGMIQAAAGFFSYFVILYTGGWRWGQQLAFNDPLYMTAVTGFFSSIIICQIADVLICRTRKESILNSDFFKNKLIYFGIFTELVVLGIIIYLPQTHQLFGTQPLTLFQVSLSIPFALLILFGDELRRYYLRRDNQFVKRYLTW